VKGADLDSNKFVAELPCGAPEKDMENREDLADDNDNGKNEEEYVNGVDNSAISVRSWKSMCSRILLDNAIPDDCRYIGRGQYRIKLFDSIESIRVVKFSLCTIILVIFWNWLVKLLGYEHDEAYDLPKFFYFDIGSVVLDCVLFSIIGRLYKKKGVDRLFPFIIPAALSCFHGSWSSEVWFLKHSLTLYNGLQVALAVVDLCSGGGNRNIDSHWAPYPCFGQRWEPHLQIGGNDADRSCICDANNGASGAASAPLLYILAARNVLQSRRGLESDCNGFGLGTVYPRSRDLGAR